VSGTAQEGGSTLDQTETSHICVVLSLTCHIVSDWSKVFGLVGVRPHAVFSCWSLLNSLNGIGPFLFIVNGGEWA
jgi:membrane-bound metal-dependent hydrolase YbcI (DUF457 family)